VQQFQVEGTLVKAEENHSGIINTTYILTCSLGNKKKQMYTLQRINTYVFKNIDAVMENIRCVTRHLNEKLQARFPKDANRRALQLICTRDNKSYYRSADDGCWRMFTYIDHSVAYDVVRSVGDFYRAGVAFGGFQELLSDFPAETLHETIPNFHNTPKRLDDLFASAKKDPQHRCGELADEMAFFRRYEHKLGEIARKIEAKEILLRVTHNDTKFNNVLLDDVTGEALSVIDLDTVMPGSALFDFGDAIRYGASTAAEDEADTSKIALDLEFFRAFAAGFLCGTAKMLTDKEIELLPLAAWTITCELAARFLKDYIDGDYYFKTSYPKQNLIRARAQIALARDMMNKMPQMAEIISELVNA